MNFLKPKGTVDFVGKRKHFGVLSAILVIASLALFFVMEPNWGIDFTGGTEIVLDFDEDTDIGEVRAAVTKLGLSDDAVQQINQKSDNQFSIRIQDATFGSDGVKNDVESGLKTAFGADFIVESRMDAQVGARILVEHKPQELTLAEVENALKGIGGIQVESYAEDNTFQVKLTNLSILVQAEIQNSIGAKSFEVVKVDSVGPKVGGDLRTQGILSMGATLALILFYVAFRFDIIFAPGAILALFHDVAITIGIFTLLQREVNLSMVGALLTIIGYSLNDTIVIYDRVRENMTRYRRSDTEKLINDSINETLGRTLATSITTLMAMAAFLLLGGPVIQNFALAMMIGIVVGTYSTIFVATPSILVMEHIKPWLVKVLAPNPGAAVQPEVQPTESK
jgi:preprotein translocase subunit SecF